MPLLGNGEGGFHVARRAGLKSCTGEHLGEQRLAVLHVVHDQYPEGGLPGFQPGDPAETRSPFRTVPLSLDQWD